MKKYADAAASFFCAAMFLPCAWKFGVRCGVQEGRGYYVFLGLVWLAGAAVWMVRGVRRWKTNNQRTDNV